MKLCYCPKCKAMREAYTRFNYNKDKTVHIRCECKQCGAFIMWIKQNEETLASTLKNKPLF